MSDIFDGDDIDLGDVEIADVYESTKLDCHCGECDRAFPGSDRAGGHCVVCHMSFTSNSGFDRHKTGSYDDNSRRCKTEAELSEANWSCSDDGNKVWRLPGSKGPWWEKQKNKGESK